MYYLVGPGRANEHTYPHLVAGDAMLELLYAGQELSHVAAGEIGKMIDTPHDRSRGKYKKFDPETETDYEVVSDNHVFHCSIAQPPDEEPLSEDTRAAIAHEFMDKMGFTETSGKAPCGCVAIHHGETKKGGDHIHIVANIVREDGTKWTQFRDYQLAQKIANELEHKHGLRVLESRERSHYAQADSARARTRSRERFGPSTGLWTDKDPACPALNDGAVARAVQGLSTTLNALSQIDTSNPASLADATADIVGLLSAMALKHEGTPFGDALHYTASG
jgi:hypothetical protein